MAQGQESGFEKDLALGECPTGGSIAMPFWLYFARSVLLYLSTALSVGCSSDPGTDVVASPGREVYANWQIRGLQCRVGLFVRDDMNMKDVVRALASSFSACLSGGL